MDCGKEALSLEISEVGWPKGFPAQRRRARNARPGAKWRVDVSLTLPRGQGGEEDGQGDELVPQPGQALDAEDNLWESPRKHVSP